MIADLLDDDTLPQRKRKVQEDQEARDMREHDRARKEEEDARRRILQRQLPNSEIQEDIIVNVTKFAEQGYVFLNKIARPKIKPHQIEGIRFLWNQLVLDHEASQGCLLAHTMGLGKTMQTWVTLKCLAIES